MHNRREPTVILFGHEAKGKSISPSSIPLSIGWFVLRTGDVNIGPIVSGEESDARVNLSTQTVDSRRREELKVRVEREWLNKWLGQIRIVTVWADHRRPHMHFVLCQHGHRNWGQHRQDRN